MTRSNWQGRSRLGVARDDITPPVGIYHRMWGAATHDRSEGVHRPLMAACLAFAPCDPSNDDAQILLAVDHCLLEAPEVAAILDQIEQTSGTARQQVTLSFSHTHAAGLLTRSRIAMPGGDLVGPYLDSLRETLGRLVAEALASMAEVHWLYGAGRCQLAAHRDLADPESGEWVCGYNPQAPADDTVLVAKAVSASGDCKATVINYACHPTTLAWDNRLISPDYPGAAREVVESAIDAPCVFLQGASGDLGPVEGFVGDCDVADRNGRQLGYAALAALESLPRVGQAYRYQGPVVSGATIGVWAWGDAPAENLDAWSGWEVEREPIALPYRKDLPRVADVDADCSQLEAREAEVRAKGELEKAAQFRALAERKRRLKERLSGLPDGGHYPFEAAMWRVGDAIWVSVQGEPYNVLQRRLREALPDTPVIVATIANGWGPSYLPPRDSYGQGIYQESIAALAPGTLEELTDTLIQRARRLKGADEELA